MAGTGDIRIGTRERDDALAALAVHHDAGRLDAFEWKVPVTIAARPASSSLPATLPATLPTTLGAHLPPDAPLPLAPASNPA